MNFSLVNPSVPEFPNSDFFIPIFHYEEKKSPACKGGVFYMLILIPYI